MTVIDENQERDPIMRYRRHWINNFNRDMRLIDWQAKRLDFVYVDHSPGRGYGVFAGRNFSKNELITQCPVRIISKKMYKSLERTDPNQNLVDLLYEDGEGDYFLALGVGSHFNHSSDPNVDWYYYKDELLVQFEALKDIRKGKELFFNYTGDPCENDDLWFDVL